MRIKGPEPWKESAKDLKSDVACRSLPLGQLRKVSGVVTRRIVGELCGLRQFGHYEIFKTNRGCSYVVNLTTSA